MTGCYGFDGQRISQEQWCRLFIERERVVALTAIGEGDQEVEVSTVWLGLGF